MFGCCGEDDLPDFLYACAHVAALRYARRAQPDEFYIRSVSSGLRASPYLEPIPATLEIHAAALLCLLRKGNSGRT